MDGLRVSGGLGGGGGGGGGGDGQAKPSETADNEEKHEESAAVTDHKGEGSSGATVSVQVCELSTADTTEDTTSSEVNIQNSARYEQCSALPDIYL